ncbi:hypothetical protein D9M71_586580 [compost metagenome]
MRGEHAGVTESVGLAEDSLPEMFEQVELEHGFHHGNQHLLSLAGAFPVQQGHADRRGQDVAAELVDDDRREVSGASVTIAVDGGQSALTLDHIVEGRHVLVGTIATIAGREGVNDLRIARAYLLVADAQALRCAGAHAVHDDVGGFHQLEQRFQALFLLEVEHDAALVAVHDQIEHRHARVSARAVLPVLVAVRRFHLDDVCAHVAEDLGGDRAKHVDGQVDDTQP